MDRKWIESVIEHYESENKILEKKILDNNLIIINAKVALEKEATNDRD